MDESDKEHLEMDYFFKTMAAVAVLFLGTSHLTQANAQTADDSFKASYIRANVVKGKTTTDQVLAKFGEPTSQTMDDSSETWIYQRGASAAQAPKKKGGGFGGFMGLVKGVAATAYELAPEKTGGAASRLYSGADRAERTANAAGALGGTAGADEQATGAGGGPSVLQISFSNGVVSSFNLR